MGRRSFFFKNYVTHLLLIVCAFAIAGGVFYYQMGNYALQTKQAELRTTVQSLAEQTRLMLGTDSEVIREIYMLSISTVAKEDAITVYVTDRQTAADGSATVSHVLPGGSGLVQTVRMPRVLGVAVVCAGGADAAVQNRVVTLVPALTGAGAHRITVAQMAPAQ